LSIALKSSEKGLLASEKKTDKVESKLLCSTLKEMADNFNKESKKEAESVNNELSAERKEHNATHKKNPAAKLTVTPLKIPTPACPKPQ